MCDKRNRHRPIAWALAAMFALAGSAATAESPLTGENAKELERLLRVPAENVVIPYSFRKLPRIPASTLDRYFMWNEIALDTTAIDHTPVDPASGEDKRRFAEQLGPHRSSYALAIVHIAMFDAAAVRKRRRVFGAPQNSTFYAGWPDWPCTAAHWTVRPTRRCSG